MATPIGNEFEYLYLSIYFVEEKNVRFRLNTEIEFFMDHKWTTILHYIFFIF